MRFAKISITKGGVHLVRITKDPNGGCEHVDTTSPERPLTTFDDALQAFASYVNDLLEVPEVWRDKLVVTTLNLSESKDGRRGLQVSVSYAVAKADDKVVSLTTPLVLEATENTQAFALQAAHLELIELVEAEATRYVNGERTQGELFGKDAARESSPAAESFNVRSAAAEVASTRKPRGRGKPRSDEPVPIASVIGDAWTDGAGAPHVDESGLATIGAAKESGE